MRPHDRLPHRPAFDARERNESVKELWEKYPLRTEEQLDALLVEALRKTIKDVGSIPDSVLDALILCMKLLAADNGIFLPDVPSGLQYDQKRLAEVELSPIRIEEFKDFHKYNLPDVLSPITKIHTPASSIGTIPLIDAIPDAKRLVHAVVKASHCAITHEIAFLFPSTVAQITHNVKRGKLPPVLDSKLDGMPLVEAYLAGTPWVELLNAPLPFDISMPRRLEHTVIVAGTGHGKTQLLQSMILRDLDSPNPPSIIVLDSTGQMVERIQKLAVFNERLRDRLLIIDPAHAPALNMFDVATPRFNAYTKEQQEDVQTEIVALFNYVFASGEYDLTAQMGTAFTYAVRLILSRKDSTISDLRALLEENPKTGYSGSAFKPDIEKLDRDTIDFFSAHFFERNLVGTRLAIARRLHKVIGVPAFRRMFTSASNALDLFSDMQKGTIVLVNTNQQLLKEDAYVLFGRYIIARALAAAFERATLDEKDRKPTILIIDEAAPYFDQTFESLLTRVRQFKLGIVIAFQHLEQANEKLRSAIASSTSVKFAGAVGFADRRWLSREMETTPEFIDAQKKDRGEPAKDTHFAVHVRNTTDHALSLAVPFGVLEGRPRMTDHEYAQMLRLNRERVAPAPLEQPRTAQPSAPKPTPQTAPPDRDDEEPPGTRA